MSEERVYRALRVLGLAFFVFITAFQLYTIVITSLKPLRDVQAVWRWVPSQVTLRPYLEMWETVPLARYFLNSLIISTCSTVIAVLIAILAAYAISRYRFRGRQPFRFLILSTEMFPGILFLLPLFIIFVNIEQIIGIKLYGSYTGLVITYLTFALPFSIWMLVGFFDTIPRELEEAAMVDGATALGALFRILIPLSTPGIIAVGIFAFLTAWGEVLFASVLTDEGTRTLAIGLQGYSTRSDVYWNQLMAASIVVSVPVVAAFLALQRYFVQGIAATGVKDERWPR
jgi:multiple sugar transport system permease protein